MIQENNKEFHLKIETIFADWTLLEKIVENHAQLFVDKYKDYSNDKINKDELDDFIVDFIIHHADEFNGILC